MGEGIYQESGRTSGGRSLDGIVTLTVAGQVFGRRMTPFMQQRSRAAIGQKLHHEIGEAVFGKSDGVEC